MNVNNFRTIVLYTIELFFAVSFIFIIYTIIRTIQGYIINQKKGGVDFGGDLERAVTENAIEKMAVTTIRDSGYVQNNNVSIENQLKVFTPNFNAVSFTKFAAELFDNIVKARSAGNTPLIKGSIDPTELPRSITAFDGNYLHNYIIRNNVENLKIYCNILTEDNARESYFLTFSRKNPFITLKGGQFLTISCPKCGGEIDMDKKLFSECPYCHNIVTFAEYDWELSNVEHVTPDTQICNLPMIKN